MKIIHITPDLNFAKNFVLPIAKIQKLGGNDVTIITHDYEYRSKLAELSIDDAALGGVILIMLNLKVSSFKFSFIQGLIQLFSILKFQRFDLVICHTTVDSFFPLLIARLALVTKIVYFNHGVPGLGYRFFLRWLLNIVEFSNMTFAHCSYTITAAMAARLKLIGLGLKKVVLISPGSACGIIIKYNDFHDLQIARVIARSHLEINDDAFVILYVGRAVKRKGIYDLLSALQLMPNRFKLLIVGPVAEDIVDLYKYNNIDITFTGYVNSVDIYYKASDVLCIPSYHEGLGYCYLEASSFGCVPICSNIPGPTDFIINNNTGMTVTPGCIQSIANSLKYLSNSRDDLQRISLAAYVSVRQYDRSVVAPAVSIALASEVANI